MSIKVKTAQTSNQITKAKGYDPKKSMLFGKAKMGTVGTASFFRIPISTRYPDGSSGDLLITGPTLFSFGLQVNTNIQSEQPDGWTFPVCLYSKEGALPEELDFVNKLKEIVETCREYLLKDEVRESVGKPNLNKYHIEDIDFSFLKHKKDDKKRIILDSPPVIYTKVIDQIKDKDNKDKGNENRVIKSIFYLNNGQILDPMTIIGVRGRVRPVFKIESIFVGAKIINVQIKLWESSLSAQSSEPVALMRPIEDEDDIQEAVVEHTQNSQVDDYDEDEKEEVSTVSSSVLLSAPAELQASDDEEKKEEVKKPTVKKTVQPKKK